MRLTHQPLAEPWTKGVGSAAQVADGSSSWELSLSSVARGWHGTKPQPADK